MTKSSKSKKKSTSASSSSGGSKKGCCSCKCVFGVSTVLIVIVAYVFRVYLDEPLSYSPRCLKGGKIPVASGLGLKAVVTGATGATGLPLVGELLKSKAFAKVVVLSRRRLTLPDEFGIDQAKEEESGRLVQHIVDLQSLDQASGQKYFSGNDIHFCCLGTSYRKASELPGDVVENFRKIDLGLVVRLAKMSKSGKIHHMSLVSSWGAHVNSSLFYMRTKAEGDNIVTSLGFPRTTVWRPGLLSRYTASNLARQATRFIKGLPTEDLARAIRLEAECEALGGHSENTQKPVDILHNADIDLLLSLQP